MKRSDIAMIVLIAGLSMLLAFAVGSSIPALKAPRVGTSVDTIEKMSSDVNDINPTVETIIGSSGSSDASKQNK